MNLNAKNIQYATETVWVLNPDDEMLTSVKSNGRVIAHTSPGCWGPMITPDFPAGHEVTKPIYVEGAEIGDAIAIKITTINILSLATTSGVDEINEDYFGSDPFVDKKCPHCGTVNPKSFIDGIGIESIKCEKCKTPIKPFNIKNGYTMIFDEKRQFGITINKKMIDEIATNAKHFSSLPSYSNQYSCNILARADFEPVSTRIMPMIGNIGTCPAIKMPSSHNAGDFGQFLINAKHNYAITNEELTLRTDGHMDCNSVTEGAILICPVKVKGAGLYVGDVHAMQGNGEIAGHTTDVSAEVVLDLSLIKGLNIDGPIVLPLNRDIPPIIKLFKGTEKDQIIKLANRYDIELDIDMYPLQFIGSGKDLNEAAYNSLTRIATLFEKSVDEIKNRATITGSVDIGRLPGVVKTTLLIPGKWIKKKNVDFSSLVENKYKII